MEIPTICYSYNISENILTRGIEVIVRIKRNYYDEAAKLYMNIEKEEEIRKSKMTEEELLAETNAIEQEATEILQKCKDMKKGSIQFISKERLENFQQLAAEAEYIASFMEMNISANTDGLKLNTKGYFPKKV